VFWRGVELYREARERPRVDREVRQGLPGRLDRAPPVHPYATLGPTVLLFVSFALFGFAGVALWALQMAWIPFWAAGVVNGLGHWWGYRNFETADTATNLTPWGVWIGGEELHNNHHAFPELGEVRAAQVGVRHRLGGDPRAGDAWAWRRSCEWPRAWTCAEHRRCRMAKP
jgi:stearoyl-CoA desaturase (Delta-9 desaturase)